MKETDKKKSVPTVPDGVWESNHPNKSNKDEKCTITTDLQGNGYPKKQSK